jgi:hypothetical protein
MEVPDQEGNFYYINEFGNIDDPKHVSVVIAESRRPSFSASSQQSRQEHPRYTQTNFNRRTTIL